MAYTEVSYGGPDTPETFDRFGSMQTYRIWGVNGDHHVNFDVRPQEQYSVLQRLGLRVLGWVTHGYHGYCDYKLDVHGRAVLLRAYEDGRLRIEVDNRVVLSERLKTVTRNWVKHKELVVETEEERQLEIDEREAKKEERERYLRERFG